MRFSPDGRQLCVKYEQAGASGTVRFRVWDIASGQLLQELDGLQGRAFGGTFSPDGTRILAADDAGTIHVWDAEDFEPLIQLLGHHLYVHSIAFGNFRDGFVPFHETNREEDNPQGRP